MGNDRRRRLALLAVGAALVTVPFWAPPLDVTGNDYEYRAALVTVEDNRVSVPGDHPRLPGVEGLDCFHESPFLTRRCAFEARRLNGSRVPADYPGVRHVRGDPTLDAPERHVAFAGDGRVFARTTGWNESAGAYVLGLERANASRVLEREAEPVGRAPRPVRRTVETGSARADEPLSGPRLVASSGRYYVVYTAGMRTFLSEKPFTERLFELVAVLFGVLTLRRVWSGAD